ncbi:hypothetical protein GTQ43_16045 [Nostoc sp. KVJ3]|nr:hypothetical protein [Nostoc sp. KVJ3]MCW5313355.1 hypothetical protein [Nostoc sp. KVJ3]MCW5315267.1 hypothetical protein [Nostoc sp. KVJ3]
MFAPQTLRLRVPQQLENKQDFQVFCNLRMKPIASRSYPSLPSFLRRR